MLLYRSKGFIWTGTQADAKEAQGGKGFETIEVPDKKAERIAWLNEHAPGMPPLVEVPAGLLEDITPEPQNSAVLVAQTPKRSSAPVPEMGTFAVGNEPAVQHHWHGNDHLVGQGQACNVCFTNRAIEDWRKNGMIALELEEMIEQITDTAALSRLMDGIREQKEHLEAKEAEARMAALPAPRPRVRTRNPVQPVAEHDTQTEES